MNEVMVARPIEEAMRVMGGRWQAVVVYFLLHGPKRFGDLQKDTGISRRILTASLRKLEEAGAVSRTVYPEVPPRVEYALTPDGIELSPIVNGLYSWGQKLIERKKKNGALSAIPLLVE